MIAPVRQFVPIVIVVCIAALVAAACGRGAPAAPVASASISASKSRLPLGAPVDITYRFELLPSATITGDYRVLVHVKNSSGDMLWQDDHDPPTPTSSWAPGQPVEYTRTEFVPVVPHLGDVTIQVGLYPNGPGERLPLQTPNTPSEREAADRAYTLGTLHLLPTSESVFVIYKTGWHPDEFTPDNPSVSWKWMQKTGVLSVRNPRKDVTLYLEYDARPDVFPEGVQQVTVSVGDQPVTTFAATSAVPSLVRVPISADQLGTTDMTDIHIDLDKTFVPAKLPAGGRDTRELGLRVFHAFIEER